MKQILVLVCMLGFQLSSACQDIAGVWSGTITMVINGTSELGPYHEKTVLSVRNNQVTGTVTREDTTIVEGKIIGVSSCSSSGAGELWQIAFSGDGRTYDIQAIGPEGQCTSTSYIAGVPGETHPFIPAGIAVYENPVGSNRNLLTGSRTESGNSPGVISQTVTTNWHLARTAGIDLIVDPANYDNWLPQPGKDELTEGALMTIRLKLLNANGSVPSVKAKKFILELTNTSNEPGITINTPQQPLFPQLHDLRFLIQSNAILKADFQSIEINCNGCVTGVAQLASYDGGGWTTLTAKAILEDNSEVEGKLLTNNGPTEILIPKRDPNSHIGIKWLDANGNPNEGDDKERSNGNSNNGDGLTAYEEYRGVMATGTNGKQEFKRLDPQKKEVGVWMKKNEVGLFEKGIRLFENAGDLTVIRFYDYDIAQDRKLNRNFATSHTYDQFVLRLYKAPLPKYTMGETAALGLPHATYIKIDVDKHGRYFPSQPAMRDQELAVTVAHELGHGVGIAHHGLHSIFEDLWVTKRGRTSTWTIRNANGEIISIRPYKLAGADGDIHNEASGDTSCLMRYANYYDWSLNDQHGPMLCQGKLRHPSGMKFCKSNAGNGINANHYNFDDAIKGNCLSLIKLK